MFPAASLAAKDFPSFTNFEKEEEEEKKSVAYFTGSWSEVYNVVDQYFSKQCLLQEDCHGKMKSEDKSYTTYVQGIATYIRG